MLYTSYEDMIGKTPLYEVLATEREEGLCARLFVKIESRNPSGSAKDRAALYMIKDAEEKGILLPGAVMIEPTSGNTGIGLAALAAARGYRLIIVMPDNMSVERQRIMAAYGAELVLTPGSEGMKGAIAKAEELKAAIPQSFIVGQFVNKANADAHYYTTGPEIFGDLDGRVDAFVAGVGTGGTVTGTARFLKEKNPSVRIFGIEPNSSAVLSGDKPGAHGLSGIGAGFIPEVLDVSLLDEVIRVTEKEAFAAARTFAKREGILVGISSGAALSAAISVAKRAEFDGKNIVVLLPDSGERYLSTALFDGDFDR